MGMSFEHQNRETVTHPILRVVLEVSQDAHFHQQGLAKGEGLEGVKELCWIDRQEIGEQMQMGDGQERFGIVTRE